MNRQEGGAALLAALILLLLMAGSSTGFVWFMNQQQTRAGVHYRASAALAAAEAGVHRALSILESATPDGRFPGRAWRPRSHSEVLPAGSLGSQFTLSLTDDVGGAIVVASTGRAGGLTRRLLARVYLASPALLAALNGASVVRLHEPPATTIIASYGAGNRAWTHIAVGRELWFASTRVSISELSPALVASPGPANIVSGVLPNAERRRSRLARIRLARDAELTLGPDHQRVAVEQLRSLGVPVDGEVLRTEALAALPEIDQEFFRAQAAHNSRNASLNAVAGKQAGDSALALKRDSLYTRFELEKIQAYLRVHPQVPALQGVIYVEGGLSLIDGQQLRIADGALVTDGSVNLGLGTLLAITHSPSTRAMPGVIVLDTGTLVLARGARLQVHGLLYANRVIEVGEGARIDAVGALLGNDPSLSLRNAGTVRIQYDPAVLGTPGLRAPDRGPVVAWVASWEEPP